MNNNIIFYFKNNDIMYKLSFKKGYILENEAFEVIKNYINLETFGYLILFLYCMGGGYVPIIAAGVLAAMGKLDLGFSIILAIIGNVLGSSMFALLARTQKGEIMRIFKKHRRKIAYLQVMIRRYDWLLFLVSKFIHGARTFVPLAVGISAYNMMKFLVINFIGAIIWGISLGLLGFYASEFFLEILKVILQKPYLAPLIFVGIVILIAFYMYIRKRLKHNVFLQNLKNKNE